MVYVAPTPKKVPPTTYQLDMIQNKPKNSQSTNLNIIATFTKGLNAPKDILLLPW